MNKLEVEPRSYRRLTRRIDCYVDIVSKMGPSQYDNQAIITQALEEIDSWIKSLQDEVSAELEVVYANHRAVYKEVPSQPH